MRKHHFVLVALTAFWLGGAALEAQMPRWLGGGGKEDFQQFRAPGGRFTVDYPKNDWQTLSGAGTVFVVFSHKKGEASVAIEHTLLNQPLAPTDISQLFADLELEQVKKRYPGAAGFRTGLFTDAQGQRVVVIDFTRSGVSGAERVRQYSLALGSDLFRLICSGKPEAFDKYIPVFERMAGTFKNGTISTGGTAQE